MVQVLESLPSTWEAPDLARHLGSQPADGKTNISLLLVSCFKYKQMLNNKVEEYKVWKKKLQTPSRSDWNIPHCPVPSLVLPCCC